MNDPYALAGVLILGILALGVLALTGLLVGLFWVFMR
jgi:hypothetical protein